GSRVLPGATGPPASGSSAGRATTAVSTAVMLILGFMPSVHGVRNELAYQIGLHGFGSAFGAEAAVLHAAERRFGKAEPGVIDRHHPGFDARTRRARALRRGGIDIRGQPVRETVRLFD